MEYVHGRLSVCRIHGRRWPLFRTTIKKVIIFNNVVTNQYKSTQGILFIRLNFRGHVKINSEHAVLSPSEIRFSNEKIQKLSIEHKSTYIPAATV